MDRDFVIISLYVPNHDNPKFYVELEKQVNKVGYKLLFLLEVTQI